jgi:hypothetical protein
MSTKDLIIKSFNDTVEWISSLFSFKGSGVRVTSHGRYSRIPTQIHSCWRRGEIVLVKIWAIWRRILKKLTQYSNAPLSTGNTFQDLPRLHETSDNTETYKSRKINGPYINTVKCNWLITALWKQTAITDAKSENDRSRIKKRSAGKREYESKRICEKTGRFWPAGYHHVSARSLLVSYFETYKPSFL